VWVGLTGWHFDPGGNEARRTPRLPRSGGIIGFSIRSNCIARKASKIHFVLAKPHESPCGSFKR